MKVAVVVVEVEACVEVGEAVGETVGGTAMTAEVVVAMTEMVAETAMPLSELLSARTVQLPFACLKCNKLLDSLNAMLLQQQAQKPRI